MLSAPIEAALRGPLSLTALDEIARQVWRALAEGRLSDGEAQRLADLAQARRAEIRNRTARTGPGPGAASGPIQASLALGDAVRRVRRPRSAEQAARLDRRRMTAACGALPPEVARYFTPGQIAALSVVAREAATAAGRGRASCDWAMKRIADRAGVRRTTVRDALRLAERLGLVRVRQRRQSRTRSDTNLVTITAKRWWAWLTRGPKRAAAPPPEEARATGSSVAGGGCEMSTPSSTAEKKNAANGAATAAERGPGQANGGPCAERGRRPLPADLQAVLDTFLTRARMR